MKFSAAFKRYLKAFGVIGCNYDLDKGIWQGANFTLSVPAALIGEVHKAAAGAKMRVYSSEWEAAPREFAIPTAFMSPDMQKAILRVSPCMSTDETRSSLSCVRIEAEHVIATDGHRLAAVKVENNIRDLVGKDFSLHASAVALLEFFDKVGVSVDKHGVVLHLWQDGIQMDVRPENQDGSFPDWKQVVPEDTPLAVCSFTQPLIKALKNPISDVKATGLHKGNASVLSVFDPEVTLSVACVDAQGNPMMHSKTSFPTLNLTETRKTKLNIGINFQYLKEGIELVEQGNIYIGDPTDPIEIRSKDDETVLCLIMPMRI